MATVEVTSVEDGERVTYRVRVCTRCGHSACQYCGGTWCDVCLMGPPEDAEERADWCEQCADEGECAYEEPDDQAVVEVRREPAAAGEE